MRFAAAKKNRRFSVYVPEELAPLVQQAVHNGRKLEELMREAGPLYRSGKGETNSRGFGEKEESQMITARYQQRSIDELLAVNCMPDYRELLWEGWLFC